MKEDLKYKQIQELKSEEDRYFESAISAFDFPLIINDDWNPYLFEVIKTTREEFLALPKERKFNYMVTAFVFNNPECDFYSRAVMYDKIFISD